MNGYGKSAIINGDTVYSTDGSDVDPDAICIGDMTVRQVVTKHQEETRGDRALDVVFFWVGLPALVIFIFWLVFSLVNWLL